MIKRSRVVYKEDGAVELKARKYNGKYLFGNLLICGYCGASYRRRTERSKVVWRCATRIEKGKERCTSSPTLNEESIKEVLGRTVCENGSYNEKVIRNLVNIIQIFDKYIIICSKGGRKFHVDYNNVKK